MDGLRPEVDELDRFNKRNSSKAQKKSDAQHVPVKGETKKTSGPSITIFAMFVICVSLGFAWYSWQQQIEITKLKDRLSDASGFMDQSKLLIARLEGKLSETGVELAETGTAAEKKLAFLDSEMRKLWGVAYDRNRKTIEENQKQLDALASKLNKLSGANSASIKAVKASVSQVSNDLESLTRLSRSLDSRLGSVANELSILRSEQDSVNANLEKRLVAQKNSLDKSAKDSQNYLKQAAKLDLSIESINASRRQLNERIVELDKKLNALQLKISPSAN